MLFATIYFANTVNAWQLCQYFMIVGYLCQCVMINEHVVFSFTKETNDSFHNETLGSMIEIN